MDHRRYYVISAMGGERGPYRLAQLHDALEEGEITGLDQVRTGMGTMLGTVRDLLGSSHTEADDPGVGSGTRILKRRKPLVTAVTVVAAFLVAGGLYQIRPGEIVVHAESPRASTALTSDAGTGTGSPAVEPVIAPTQQRAPVAVSPKASSSYPKPLVELAFSTITDGATPNTGSSAKESPNGFLSHDWPRVVERGPGAKCARSVDFGTEAKPYAVDISETGKLLANLTSLTLTGWVNNRGSQDLLGGNRIICWRKDNAYGVDLAYHGDGSLQIGINAWNDLGHPRSSSGMIPTDPQGGADNWRFFAVTYDSQLTKGQTNFYFGSPYQRAILDKTVDDPSGPVGSNVSPGLTIGNLIWQERQSNTVSVFRGLITQVRIWGSDHDSSGALTLPQIIAVQQLAVEDPGH